MWWPAVVKSQTWLQIQLELSMMSGMSLETCRAFNERWNNIFYYKVASCWLFLLNHNINLECNSNQQTRRHPYRVTNTRCLIDKAVSPDDGHTVARNMYRREINILSGIVHLVGFICKIVQRCTVNKTQNEPGNLQWDTKITILFHTYITSLWLGDTSVLILRSNQSGAFIWYKRQLAGCTYCTGAARWTYLKERNKEWLQNLRNITTHSYTIRIQVFQVTSFRFHHNQ